MSRGSIARYLNPWKYEREQEQVRLAALRARDGDECRRCRRPMRFDLPPGHHRGPRIEPLAANANGGGEAIANLCLTHGRCNAEAADVTGEVLDRIRRHNEAALLARKRGSRSRRAGANPPVTRGG